MITLIALVTLHCDHQDPGGKPCFAKWTFGGGPEFSTAWDAARRAGWAVDSISVSTSDVRCPKHARAGTDDAT